MADAAKIQRLQAALDAYHAGELPPLFDYQAEEAKATVRKRALRLLDQRARSRHELEQRLLHLEFPQEVVVEVLDDLERVELLNDTTFAYEWVRQRSIRRGKSRMALNLELKNKGVAQSIRAAALEQIDNQAEEETATQLAVKKARTIHKLGSKQDYQKQLRRILGVLARRGFPQDISMRVARSALENRIQELSE